MIRTIIDFFCQNLDIEKEPENAQNFDISRHSNSYFLNTPCFTNPAKVLINIFLLGENYFKTHQF